MITKHCEFPCVFLLGGIVYMLIEITWRGVTHWSMGLCGGLCFLEIYLLEVYKTNMSLWKKCLCGSILITLNEFVTGIIVNLLLKWNVWDYSGLILNLLGQVCLLYSLLWFLLCIPAFKIARLLKNKLFSPKEKIPI